MIIKKLVDNVYINGVPAQIGMSIKPYDMIDARQGVVEFESGSQLAYLSTRLVDTEFTFSTEREPVVEPQVTDAVTTETPPAVKTTKTSK